jgi:hypothetical protein
MGEASDVDVEDAYAEPDAPGKIVEVTVGGGKRWVPLGGGCSPCRRNARLWKQPHHRAWTTPLQKRGSMIDSGLHSSCSSALQLWQLCSAWIGVG